MDIPKYQETFIPILKVLSDGSVISTGELLTRVRDEFYSALPQELLERRAKSGNNLLQNRIAWGKAYLKQGEYITSPAYGKVQITERGRKALDSGKLTLNELRNDEVFLAKRRDRNTSSEELSEESTPQDLIDSGVQQIETQVKDDILAKLKTTDPYYFEKVVLKLLKAMGYGDFEGTPKSGDGGIDGIIRQDKLGLEKIYVQAKRYAENNKVHETDIRNFIGAMSRAVNKGIFVTTSSFDQKAIEKAQDATQKIILIDGDMLASYMYVYGVGVQVSAAYTIKQIDEDFFQETSI